MSSQVGGFWRVSPEGINLEAEAMFPFHLSSLGRHVVLSIFKVTPLPTGEYYKCPLLSPLHRKYLLDNRWINAVRVCTQPGKHLKTFLSDGMHGKSERKYVSWKVCYRLASWQCFKLEDTCCMLFWAALWGVPRASGRLWETGGHTAADRKTDQKTWHSQSGTPKTWAWPPQPRPEWIPKSPRPQQTPEQAAVQHGGGASGRTGSWTGVCIVSEEETLLLQMSRWADTGEAQKREVHRSFKSFQWKVPENHLSWPLRDSC